ncbi:YwaF family protein [Clostridium septicum]|uniref:TIGR02206 family membrane protein n=1 Tax=Clostridium septicum TaxID=1504 RepID=A0A9N7PK00_CLOSE|nr:TIGR02206 family membrane protein [Clostridium septicum]AYE35130.1 TIGR02206 family membrane protein [Clostridium septicum]MDU1314229.1 TIGR02206 family membrane protein [Clostridium septicum]QAS60522.1 TIGR02206 family membrane protein [Clostridium septicum]UEC20218.1 TIGR02206 family membrane protein [Clostridium septicum]USS01728.1 TIGR02206 family membrane protein [Clostridium septicum]
MKDFFTLNIPNKYYTTSFTEQIIPIILLCIAIVLICFYRNEIRSSKKLDKIIRYSIGIVSLVVLITYYFTIWIIEGIKADNLPFHLCYLTNILCIILVFSKNRTLFNFSIFTGVLGGISSLISVDMELYWRYFKYYQFMIGHTMIVFVPLYFLIIYNYIPSFKDAMKAFITLQIIGLPMGIFNEIYKTNYFFVSFGSNEASKGTFLTFLGDGYMYLFNLELLAISCIICWYIILKFICKKLKKSSPNIDYGYTI